MIELFESSYTLYDMIDALMCGFFLGGIIIVIWAENLIMREYIWIGACKYCYERLKNESIV